MVGNFFELVAQFAQSADEEEPLSRLVEILDKDGRELFSRELKAISLLEMTSRRN